MRGRHNSLVGDRAHRADHLNGLDGQRLAKRHGTQRRAVVFRALLDDAERFTREIDARGLAELKPVDDILRKRIGAELLAHQDHTGVGGAAQDLTQAHRHSRAALIDISNDIAAHKDLGGDVERRVGRQPLVLDGRGGYKGLEDRTGLVDIGHDA